MKKLIGSLWLLCALVLAGAAPPSFGNETFSDEAITSAPADPSFDEVQATKYYRCMVTTGFADYLGDGASCSEACSKARKACPARDCRFVFCS